MCAAQGQFLTADEPDVVRAAAEATFGYKYQDEEEEEGAYDGDVDTVPGAVLPPELVAVVKKEEIDYTMSKGVWDRFESLAELRQQVKAEGRVLDNKYYNS